MDPDACQYRIWSAIKARDFEEATAALIDLATWIEKGGAKPKDYREVLEKLPTLF